MDPGRKWGQKLLRTQGGRAKVHTQEYALMSWSLLQLVTLSQHLPNVEVLREASGCSEDVWSLGWTSLRREHL